ncbi:MAG: 2-iminobutanoate/2-iminopropanoate deaminase [Paracoccaceae bacterium]|jgi:2-iminobutanoate/2-iminopropanoate deaminase
MSRRKSIHIDGFAHKNPIPNASVIGNMLVTGVIMGRDTRSETVPDTIEEQCAIMFRHVRDIVEAAGGTTDDILKMSVWLKNTSDRSALNAEWTAMFPDPENRPARHAFSLESDSIVMVQCDFMAVLGD